MDLEEKKTNCKVSEFEVLAKNTKSLGTFISDYVPALVVPIPIRCGEIPLKIVPTPDYIPQEVEEWFAPFPIKIKKIEASNPLKTK